MSTGSEIGRTPAIDSRRCIHRGEVAAGSIPVTVSATNSEQASSSSSTG